jgi:membrane protein
MARLRDVPKILSSVGLVPFATRLKNRVGEHRLATWASALSYSWLMAVFPFFIFLLTLLPYLPQQMKDRAKTEVSRAVYQALPLDAANTVWENIDKNLNNLLHQKQGKGWYRFLGIALALWAASAGMAMTMTALDSCYEVKEVRSLWRQRLLALELTLVVSVLMIVVMCLLPVGGIVKAWVVKSYPGMSGRWKVLLVVLDVVRWVLALAFLITVLAVIYYKGPAVKQRFHWLTPGAVFCIVVWVVLGLAFRLYVSMFGNYDKTYGAAGGVVVLLIFFYIDAFVLLMGAEINSEIDFAVLPVKPGTVDLRPAEDEVVAKEEAEAAEAEKETPAPADAERPESPKQSRKESPTPQAVPGPDAASSSSLVKEP